MIRLLRLIPNSARTLFWSHPQNIIFSASKKSITIVFHVSTSRCPTGTLQLLPLPMINKKLQVPSSPPEVGEWFHGSLDDLHHDCDRDRDQGRSDECRTGLWKHRGFLLCSWSMQGKMIWHPVVWHGHRKSASPNGMPATWILGVNLPGIFGRTPYLCACAFDFRKTWELPWNEFFSFHPLLYHQWNVPSW